MKAIETHYVGPSNVRGSRIIATDNDGHRAIVSYNNELNSEAAHAEAAITLCTRMKWSGTLIAGWTKRGYVFVFDTGTRYQINGECGPNGDAR